VDIRQCPKMEVFSQGRINAKSFRGIQASSNSNDDLVFYNNDLNASVRRVFLLQVGTSSKSVEYDICTVNIRFSNVLYKF
jgi:hypothetical protein